VITVMSHDVISDLVERYLNDSAFASDFVHDPERAVTAAGFDLDESEIAALHARVLSHDDQVLRPRVSKYSFGS
jgi:hypothetical protein